jgi:acyl-CoA reductase-like NAD-dependent aldehyde dehydrogenase
MPTTSGSLLSYLQTSAHVPMMNEAAIADLVDTLRAATDDEIRAAVLRHFEALIRAKRDSLVATVAALADASGSHA